MKKKFKMGLIIGALVAVTLLVFMNLTVKKANETIINTIDFSQQKDGEYKGIYSIAPVTVETVSTIKDGKLIDIKIIRHDKGLGGKAETIIDEVIKKQSLEVDGVAGATVSSRTILKSIEKGFNK